MSKPILEARGLTKEFLIPHERRNSVFERIVGRLTRSELLYEKFMAVNDASFDIRAGECVALIGHNGSGKTTTLRMLAGILQPSAGTLKIDAGIVPLLELGIGVAVELSARDNIYLYGAILGITRSEIRKRFDEIVAFAELERFVDTPLRHYSSGMRLRLAFATAIQARGDIFLLDEVLAVGDAAFQRKCLERMREFQREGRTFVLVNHSMGAIKEFCQRAILLERGRLLGDGPVEQIAALYEGRSKVSA